jgi:transcription antitermination factor NusG
MIGWVKFGGEIPWLPDEIMSALIERSELINREGGLWTRFQPGEKVQVVSGHLEGLAEVIRGAKSPNARVQVLLEFMGRQVRAQVPWDSLRPIDDHPVEKQRAPRRTRGKNRWVREFRPAAIAAV